jgi:peptide-methionine (S)-S-oxide reductase
MSRYVLGLLLLILQCNANATTAEAIFSGGNFWYMQSDFDTLPGVLSTLTGYDGGMMPNPNYHNVSTGNTDYVEAIKVVFDPSKLSYQQLLHYFWLHVDPTDKNGQFCDKGRPYHSVIFYLNEEQKKLAISSKLALQQVLPSVYTDIMPTTQFYAADDSNQNYYKKNFLFYKYYRWRCHRDQRLKDVWQHTRF